jgi:hypothetical protein
VIDILKKEQTMEYVDGSCFSAPFTTRWLIHLLVDSPGLSGLSCLGQEVRRGGGLFRSTFSYLELLCQ